MVKATAIITNSATDPHDFEPTTADAKKFKMQKLLLLTVWAMILGFLSLLNQLISLLF